MAVRELELFHGLVLAKLVRSDRPITLRMIETSPQEAWSSYIINDQVKLLIKHCARQRKLTRVAGSVSWTFVFGQRQLSQLHPDQEVWAALVGGGTDVKRDTMRICLLDPDQIQSVLNLQAPSSASLTVRYLPGKQLRVMHQHKVAFYVPQARLDNWIIPGS